MTRLHALAPSRRPITIRRVLNHETSPNVSPEPVPPQASSGLRFLLAEDGAVNRAVFVGLLEAKGHHVTSVEDGQAAVETWRHEPFSAIFMDLQMPVLHGLEATRMIRHEEQVSGQRIPIIAITAAAMESDYLRCLEAGMDDYLSKPVDFAQLDRLLELIQTGNMGYPDDHLASTSSTPQATATDQPSSHPHHHSTALEPPPPAPNILAQTYSPSTSSPSTSSPKIATPKTTVQRTLP